MSNKHGLSKTKLFAKWQTMKQRCYDKNKQHYEKYGGRGIKVCDEWLSNFVNFYNWSVENGYKEGLTLDRINVNGNYEPNNCRWVDLKTQANNKRNNKIVEHEGVRYTVAELSEKYNVNYPCLYYRLTHGWSVEKAISTLPKIGRNQHEKI